MNDTPENSGMKHKLSLERLKNLRKSYYNLKQDQQSKIFQEIYNIEVLEQINNWDQDFLGEIINHANNKYEMMRNNWKLIGESLNFLIICYRQKYDENLSFLAANTIYTSFSRAELAIYAPDIIKDITSYPQDIESNIINSISPESWAEIHEALRESREYNRKQRELKAQKRVN